LYFDKYSLSFVMKLIIEQLGLAMETNPQHETGSWLHHGTRCEHSEAEIPGNVTALEGTSRLYSIREMAQDFQVSIRTLRFYEDRGLLHPRREGTNRRYDSRDRLCLKMILKGKTLGFTLSEIADILAGGMEDSGKMELEMGLLPEQITAQIDYLQCQRSQIDEAIKTLCKAHRRMLELPKSGEGLDRSGH
jgi:DNA-binding transcriptional MerR regulator